MEYVHILSVILLGCAIAGGATYLTLQWVENRDQEATERVFVYGTLTHPMARFYACRCVVDSTPTTLPGYRVEERNLIAEPSAVADGYLLSVTPVELARFDRYERVPERYVRERITVGGTEAWVYRKTQPDTP